MLIGRAADGSNLNVSAAVDTAKAVQRQQETAAQQDSPAYQVELSGAKESDKSHWIERGTTAYLTHRADQSLEDELAELQAGIEEILSRPRTGMVKSANATLDNLDGKIEVVDLTPLLKKELTPEEKAIRAELDRLSQNNRPGYIGNIKLNLDANGKLTRPDITTIKSQHYTWTFTEGLKENTAISKAADVQTVTDKLQNTLKQNISDTISDILKPYASYSEAYDILKDKNVWVDTYAQAGDTILQESKEISGGLFGKLASQLNDYAKNFGTDDKFFEDIKTAFGVITGDSPDKNPLLTQIEKMVRYVQGGGELDVKDKKYQEDVDEAIAKTYKKKSNAQNVGPDKKQSPEIIFKTDTSYLDNLRQQLNETAEMLDKMTGKQDEENQHKVKTARDVLDSRAPEDSFDMDFHQRLAHVDDRITPITDTSHGIFNHKKPTDALTENDTDELAALQAGWNDYVKSHNLIDTSKVTTVFLS